MKTYKLIKNPLTNDLSPYAVEVIDDVTTGVHVHREQNQEYLAWLELGNEPLPPDEDNT